MALENIKRFKDDWLSYSQYARVGEAIARISRDTSVLDAAIHLMTAAYEQILDPAMGEEIGRFERRRREFPDAAKE
jgi:hypothetical protein